MNDIIGTIKLVLSEPTTCWSKLSKKTVNDALLYLVVIMAAYGVLAVLMMTLWAGPLGAGIGIVGVLGSLVFGLVMSRVLGSLVFGLVMSLVAAWLYNVIIGFLGVKGEFKDAFRALAYGATPGMLLGWIPFIGILGSLWSLVLQVIGLKDLYGTDFVKVIIALVIEIVIFGVLSMILMMVFGAAFMGMLFAAGQA
ncbi:MAG TPA: YIP1 family protein [Candidatus Nanoarchaeia archaeon]|nr:YIP1 family protein [Candidatus Nanoarchaeia archaeon]